MQVKFQSDEKLAGRRYKAGLQAVADKLAYTQEFKQLVKAGKAVMMPKDQVAIAHQLSKDELATAKAEQHRQSTLRPND